MFAQKRRQMHIRPILPHDNPQMASIIRTVMTEYGAVGTGYSILDPEVDAMFEHYPAPQSAYYVLVDEHDEVVGGGGFGPLQGAESHVCELRKMYYLPKARGKGFGKKLLELCFVEAQKSGYKQMYLESIERMQEAARLYRAAGFEPLTGTVGATGHSACNSFYIKTL